MNRANIVAVFFVIIFIAVLHWMLFKFWTNINTYWKELHNQDRRFIKPNEYKEKKFYIISSKVWDNYFDINYEDIASWLKTLWEIPQDWLFFKTEHDNVQGIYKNQLYNNSEYVLYGFNKKGLYLVNSDKESWNDAISAFEELYNKTSQICQFKEDQTLICRKIQPRTNNI